MNAVILFYQNEMINLNIDVTEAIKLTEEDWESLDMLLPVHPDSPFHYQWRQVYTWSAHYYL